MLGNGTIDPVRRSARFLSALLGGLVGFDLLLLPPDELCRRLAGKGGWRISATDIFGTIVLARFFWRAWRISASYVFRYGAVMHPQRLRDRTIADLWL